MNQEYLVILLICVTLLIVALWIFDYNKRLILELQLQLSTIKQLKDEKERNKKLNKDELMNQLKAYFDEITSNENNKRTCVHEYILSSQAYKDILSALDKNTAIIKDSLWNELSEEVNTIHPDFKDTLYTLNRKLTEHEYRVCLLLKCGFTPKQIAHLTNHSQESVSSTRRRLCYKFFHIKGKPSDCDSFIYSI